jgi:hypothetical protein
LAGNPIRRSLFTSNPPLTELNKTARTTIYRWIFSYCESEEEYLVSKALFQNFVQSNKVKDHLNLDFLNPALFYLFERMYFHMKNIFVTKTKWHGLFHHTNCGHEETNNSMPQNQLD